GLRIRQRHIEIGVARLTSEVGDDVKASTQNIFSKASWDSINLIIGERDDTGDVLGLLGYRNLCAHRAVGGKDQLPGDLTKYALLTLPGRAAQFRVAPPGFHFFGLRL